MRHVSRTRVRCSVPRGMVHPCVLREAKDKGVPLMRDQTRLYTV